MSYQTSLERLQAATLVAAGQMSFGAIRELVCNAICTQEGSGNCCYIVDMYPDSVVYESCGQDGVEKYYQRSYSILDGVVTLGDATEVERQVSYVPLTAACTFQGTADATGQRWPVRILAFGEDKNGIYWDRQPLVAALFQFNGAKCFALMSGQHQAGSQFGKSPRELVGVFADPRVEADGIYATLVILPSAGWLVNDLKACEANQVGYAYALSVDITASTKTVTISGKKMKAPDVIKNVQVDVVYDPAAGGEFLQAAVSGQTEESHMKLLQRLLAALARGDQAEASRIQAALDAKTLTEEQATEQVMAALERTENPAQQTQVIQAKGDGADVLQEMKLMSCSMILDRELSNSKLPEAAQENIRASFTGKIFDVSALQASIKSTKEMLDKLTASGAVEGAGSVRIVVDSIDKAGQYLDDFFDGKVNSFKAAYQDITGDVRMTGDLRDATNLRAAIATTGFTEILGDSLTRRMVAEYNLAALDDWKKIVNIVPLSDFRTQRRPRMGGYGNLPAVAQSGAYTALTSPADEEATYTPSKRGGTESITLEAIRNDDVGGIRRVPVKLGRAAARTLYVFVFDFFATNPTLYDTVAFFHATHANLAVAALSKAQLQAGRLQIMKQTEAGSAEVLGIPPRFLLVPPDLEDTAFELTSIPASGLFTPTAPDAVRRQTYETITVKTWTDTNNWYLTCDPADIPGIEIGFLDGKQEPELFVQDMPNVGSMFSNDQLTYKIRHIYGGAVVDFRGSQGNVVP